MGNEVLHESIHLQQTIKQSKCKKNTTVRIMVMGGINDQWKREI